MREMFAIGIDRLLNLPMLAKVFVAMGVLIVVAFAVPAVFGYNPLSDGTDARTQQAEAALRRQNAAGGQSSGYSGNNLSDSDINGERRDSKKKPNRNQRDNYSDIDNNNDTDFKVDNKSDRLVDID